AVEFEAVRAEDAQVGCPDLAKALDERLRRLFLRVDVDRYEALRDRIGDGWLLVRHGTQHLAAASGRGEEGEQEEVALVARGAARLVEVAFPGDGGHGRSLRLDDVTRASDTAGPAAEPVPGSWRSSPIRL